MAERGKHRVAPVPALAKKQYAYVPCPRSEEVGTEFALQLLQHHHEPDRPETPLKSPPGELPQSSQFLKTFLFAGNLYATALTGKCIPFLNSTFNFISIGGEYFCHCYKRYCLIYLILLQRNGNYQLPTRFLLVFQKSGHYF